MVDRLKYSIENGSTVISINNTVPTGFVKLEGRMGFGVAPTTLITTEGAVEGAKWRRTRRGARVIDFPLGIFGTDRADVESKLRLLVKTLRATTTPAKLVATYPDGKRVYTYVHYSGGIDPQYGKSGDTEGQAFCKLVLSLMAPSPYWTDETAVSRTLTAPNQGRGLLPDLEKLQLSSSQALGTLTAENPGDVDAWPVWVVKGPASSFTATLGTLTFTYDAAIASGETVTVDTVAKTVKSSISGDVYANLAPAPKLFPVPAGISVVTAEAPDSDANTTITMYFNPRRELIY